MNLNEEHKNEKARLVELLDLRVKAIDENEDKEILDYLQEKIDEQRERVDAIVNKAFRIGEPIDEQIEEEEATITKTTVLEFTICPLCMGSGCECCNRGYIHVDDEDELEWQKVLNYR